MSTQAITNAGRALFASKQATGQELTIDRFMLANVDGLDHGSAVNLDEQLPTLQDQVRTLGVTRRGYIGPDEIVYSLYLSSSEGSYTYNWIGLLAEDDTLVAAAYLAPVHKEKSENGSVGNTLNENIMLAYTDAQAITNLSVDASTWQWDFETSTESLLGLIKQSSADQALSGLDAVSAMSPFRVHQSFKQFGLGSSRNMPLPNGDANEAKINGWYRVNSGDENVGALGAGSVIIHSSYWDDLQEAQQIGQGVDGSLKFRSKSGGSWGAWKSSWIGLSGAVMSFTTQTVPEGWLECDGSQISRTTYSELFSKIGTVYGIGNGSTSFNVPDFRAEFLRGWDHGKGIDSGRGLGVSQAESIKSHAMAVPRIPIGSVHGGGGAGFIYDNSNYQPSSQTINYVGGGETRPRNFSVMYCIKY